MNKRAAELIDLLDLRPHPEGGYFGEVYKSTQTVLAQNGKAERKALTSIYFLLPSHQYSAWHMITGDEVWHYYEGDPLNLYQIDPESKKVSPFRLGKVSEECRPVAVVPGGVWQAAETAGSYTLAGCTVGPGFEFEDFRLLREDQDAEELIKSHFPNLTGFL
jgi:hypothetical protein